MRQLRLITEPAADADIEAAFVWYERQERDLGLGLLQELGSAYDRIIGDPQAYRDLGDGIRRVLLHRFPYFVYYAVEPSTIVVVAVLHAHRDPAVWQRRSLRG